MKTSAVISSLILISLVATAAGLRCYNCISFPSKRDVGCETGNTTLMLTVECPATHKYCSTFRSIVSANNISESGPAYVRNCEEKRSTTGLAVYCRQDLCNAGSRDFGHLNGCYLVALLLSVFTFGAVVN